MNMKAFFLICLISLVGCNADQALVKINTSGIFNPVTYSIDDEDASGKTLDLGEHLLTDEPRALSVKVHNKTKFPYTNLDLQIAALGDLATSISFAPTPTGELKFPGEGGTCETTLSPGETCEIRVIFAPREGRNYTEILTLNFNNYVEKESHVATIKVIAGMPASLVFTNDITQYTFGDLIGPSKIAVVEREDGVLYSQELEIVNAGGLPAKKINISLAQSCLSPLTNSCPEGMNGAFTLESTCPEKLFSGEKCKATITFRAKNQDPAGGVAEPEIKEINYRATVNFDYIKNPRGGTGALNGYFKTTSTNIEAKFKVPISTLSFDNPIVSGNRDSRSFRISNMGYREGKIEALEFRDSGGAILATCKGQAASDFLSCEDGQNHLLPLSTFPFTVKDRTGCLTTAAEEAMLVEVGAGCVFDLFFQPSVTFLTDKLTEFIDLQPQVIFDSRWKGRQTIRSNKLFNLSAKSKAAARLVLDKIRYDVTNYTGAGNSPWEIDLGRLTLQSANFFRRKLILITFKNVGSVDATELSFQDASGRLINLGGSTVNLGIKNPYYYSSVIASDSNCTMIAPNELCTITMMFAPIGLDTNAEEDANMFDATGADGRRYKGFKVTYNSGASFTDLNIDANPDFQPVTVETRLKAQLIRKGMLMQLSEDSRNLSQVGASQVVGDTGITHVYLQNIGTGPVPYFRLLNPPSVVMNNYSAQILPTPDPASLGAEYDCLAIGDEDLTYTVPLNATPATRTGLFSSLPKEESCVYTIQFKSADRFKVHNSKTASFGLPTATTLEEGTRFFSREAEASGGSALWEFDSISGRFINSAFSIRYFDGDSSDPLASSSYGNALSLTNYTTQVNQAWPSKVIPYNFLPFLTATLYRPGFTYPSLSASQPSLSVPETWFYGITENFNYVLNDPSQSSAFIQGDDSRFFVPTLAAYANRANYDYIYYLGSFPEGSGAFSFTLGLKNYGGFAAKIKRFDVTPDPAFSVLGAPGPLPLTVPSNADVLPLSFSFNPSTPGEHWVDLDYQYENGKKTQPLIYRSNAVASNIATVGREVVNQKMLVVAHVMQSGTYPELTMTAQDYEVIQNEGTLPPTQILQAPYNVPLSWNTFSALSTLVFDTIKLTAAPKTSDVYALKKLTFTNNTSNPLIGLNILFRPDVSTSSAKNLPSSFRTLTSSSPCSTGITLIPGQSCEIILRYQPGAGDTTDSFILSMVYSAGAGRSLMQNAGITLFPRSPGQLYAVARTTEVINYKVGPTSASTTRTSYPLNFGTVTLNVVPKVFKFDAASSTYQKVQLANSQSTKASLLLSYHKYLSANSLRGYTSSILPATSIVPQASEYRTHAGEDYAKIYAAKYADGTERHVIEASKGCFFGDDETNALIPHHQKGFNNTTVKPCFIIVTFNADFSYLLKTISITNGDDMRGTASELWYYSVNRSSSASLWVHVKGVINPDVTVATGAYSNVRAFDNKSVQFSVPKFTVASLGVGDIVGIRVLVSSNPTGLNNPYATTLTSYFDIRPYDAFSTQFANFVSGLANGQYFYFRAVAIRKDSRFVDGTPKRFVGLNSGEYLSLGNNLAAPLAVVVPPLNHYYFHTQKIVVDKFMTGTVMNEPYKTSAGRCTSRARMLIKNPSNLYYSYQLIKKGTWDLLLTTPGATGYMNMTEVAHWLGETPVSIDAKCSSLPGFLAGQSSQMLDSSAVFYIRNTVNPLGTVNYAIGGIPGTTNSNYQSYVDGTIGFAGARCMVVLP
jgi:hypothetical protein